MTRDLAGVGREWRKRTRDGGVMDTAVKCNQ